MHIGIFMEIKKEYLEFCRISMMLGKMLFYIKLYSNREIDRESFWKGH